MFTSTKIYKRPSTDLAWHTTIVPEVPTDILDSYLAVEQEFDKKKTREIDDSKPLELEITVNWTDKADYTAYWNKDAVLAYFSKINAYYTANGGYVGPRSTS
jgi:hypothetical protein